MKITAMFSCLWSTCLVFSIPQQRHRYYDAAKLEIKQDSEADDASMNLPHQSPIAPSLKNFRAHDASMNLPHQSPTAPLKDTKVDAAQRHLQQKPLMRLDSEADDASMNLPHQSSTAPASKAAAAFKFLLPEAPLKDTKVDAAQRHLQQKPLMHLDSEADDASMNLPHQSPTAPASKAAATFKFLLPEAPASKDDAAYELSPLRSPIAPHPLSSELSDGSYEQKTHVSSDESDDDYYEEESFPYFDEDNEDSLYPGGVEETVTEEEVAEANDDIELTDYFLLDYLSNEDIDIETE